MFSIRNLLIFLLFFSFSYVLSQEKDTLNQKYLDDNLLDFLYISNPLVEISYGYGSPFNNKITDDFANVGNWHLKLGKSKQKYFRGFLVDLSERYLFGSYISSSIQNISDDIGITTSTYQFGFGSRDGIGYSGSFLTVIPYVAQDFVWSKLNSYNTNNVCLAIYSCPDFASQILNDYQKDFRFGDKASYGLKVGLASILQLNVSYETSVIYRRHLFWYWSGSFILSQAGYNMLGYFTDDLVDNSPVIGTLFNFLLKAGYQYGYYLLRKEDMNWPFNTSKNETPLRYETLNVGFTFLF